MVRRRFSAVSNHEAASQPPSFETPPRGSSSRWGPRKCPYPKTERTMKPRSATPLLAFACALIATTSARAADVTYERLANPDKEPQNWLMNHRDFGAQRDSPLDMINKQNVKNMRVLFAVALGGTSGNEALEA